MAGFLNDIGMICWKNYVRNDILLEGKDSVL